eukprot:gnl/Ergobibamus_cyprinoides/353.p1 GENE.gnl/Ergobibamus_cyprinoides/353~~gnl/Ergobibamus_cyprinoides/353.p1  ORF type:complete len:277 (+),score=25.48 gnl/Ergobibamus_cyprinoides/353:100-930(+)
MALPFSTAATATRTSMTNRVTFSHIVDQDCPICQEPVSDPADLHRLRCGHALHRRCLLNWACFGPLPGADRCPFCRKPHSLSWRDSAFVVLAFVKPIEPSPKSVAAGLPATGWRRIQLRLQAPCHVASVRWILPPSFPSPSLSTSKAPFDVVISCWSPLSVIVEVHRGIFRRPLRFLCTLPEEAPRCERQGRITPVRYAFLHTRAPGKGFYGLEGAAEPPSHYFDSELALYARPKSFYSQPESFERMVPFVLPDGSSQCRAAVGQVAHIASPGRRL